MQTADTVPHSSSSTWTAIEPWVVCFSAALFFFFEFMQVNIFNALDPSLMRDFHVGAVEIGSLSAYYFIANVAFLIPAGSILDRLSTRRLIIIAMIATVTCTFLLSFSTTLWEAKMCRFVTGIGGAFCLLSSVRLASRWFPPKRMALVMGLVVTFAMTGGMLAQTPFTLLTDHYGRRSTLRLDALLGLVLLIIIFAFVKNYPKGHQKNIEEQLHQLQEIGLWMALKKSFFNVQNWLAGIYASLINLPIFLLGATWGSLFLVQVHHFTRKQASLIISMMFVGMIIGSPAMGWLSDSIKRRKLPMVVGAILSLAVILEIMYAANLGFYALFFLFFLLGFMISSQIIAYPLVAENNLKSLTGTAESLASLLIMSGGFLIPVFPVLLNWHWSHLILEKIPFYSPADYHSALAIMPIAFAIALLASLFIKETYCKALDEREPELEDTSFELATPENS